MQFSLPLPVSFHKLTLVVVSIFPGVSAKPMRLATLERALVMVSVRKVILSLSVFVAVEQFAFVDIVFVFEGALTLLSSITPLSFIADAFIVPPNPKSVLFACLPLTFVDLAIIPLEIALAFSLIFAVVSCVEAIVVHLAAMQPLVVLEIPLENGFGCYQNPVALHSVAELSEVD